MKYHKKTILSPAEFFPLFYQNLRHRKKTFFFSNFCVSKELLQYFTCIPFDLNLDIEMIVRKKITKMSALRLLCNDNVDDDNGDNDDKEDKFVKKLL